MRIVNGVERKKEEKDQARTCGQFSHPQERDKDRMGDSDGLPPHGHSSPNASEGRSKKSVRQKEKKTVRAVSDI